MYPLDCIARSIAVGTVNNKNMAVVCAISPHLTILPVVLTGLSDALMQLKNRTMIIPNPTD